ncbi:hypothetical protein CDAR_236211 [Caerostris darwini]|uniref:Uncharacterized protein n=1 Tax=Caerostris darwini TaxID=1538125 RepID=A0AAV4TAK7_9ARAC|nr:hypothetical protein CDAR_236211 [Caerostris darwini]
MTPVSGLILDNYQQSMSQPKTDENQTSQLTSLNSSSLRTGGHQRGGRSRDRIVRNNLMPNGDTKVDSGPRNYARVVQSRSSATDKCSGQMGVGGGGMFCWGTLVNDPRLIANGAINPEMEREGYLLAFGEIFG